MHDYARRIGLQEQNRNFFLFALFVEIQRHTMLIVIVIVVPVFEWRPLT